MSKVLAEIALDPIGARTPSESDVIACAEQVLKKAAQEGRGISYKIGAMSTTVEGELHDVLMLIEKMHEESFINGVQRVISNIRIDQRKDKTPVMKQYVNSVEKKLAKSM